jgi:hypothetical protein
MNTWLCSFWIYGYFCHFMHIFLHSLWNSNCSQTWLCNLWVYGHCCDFMHICLHNSSESLDTLVTICILGFASCEFLETLVTLHILNFL